MRSRLAAWWRQRFAVTVTTPRDALEARFQKLAAAIELSAKQRLQLRAELDGARTAFLSQIVRLEADLAREKEITGILTSTLGTLGAVEYLRDDLQALVGRHEQANAEQRVLLAKVAGDLARKRR